MRRSPPSSSSCPGRISRLLLFFASLLTLLFGLRLWLAGFAGVHPDEAYYWVWSLKPALGYLDHPPMIAWLIAAGRWLVETVVPEATRAEEPFFWAQVGLRFVPYFLSSVVTPLLVGTCIEWIQRAPMRLSQMLAVMTVPVFLLGPQIITPDTPFFMAWTLCLLVAIGFQRRRVYNHLAGDPTPPQYSLSLVAGSALAFAAYSKHSAVIAAFLIVVSGMGLWNSILTGFVCLALLAPHLYWNATVGVAEQAGIFFQFQNALGTVAPKPNFKWFGDVWASQLLLWTPLVFIGCWVYLFVDIRRFFMSNRLSRLSGTLFLWTFVPVAFFSLTALSRPAEANWPLVGSIAATAWVVARFRNRVVWLWSMLFSNVAMLTLGFLILTQGPVLADVVQGFAPRIAKKLRKRSRLEEFSGWDRAHTLLSDAVASDTTEVRVESYQLLSALLFVDSVAPPTRALNGRLRILPASSRRSEFNRLPEYMPSEDAHGPYWALLREKKKRPDGCHFYQDIVKGSSQILYLYRCGA
jgi:hypothetical protein